MASPRLHSLARLFAFLVLVAGSGAAADTSTSSGENGGEADGPFAGLLQAPEANLFSGALSQVIPIHVPPGRKNATPDLKLVYSTLGGGSGLVGEGWSFPLGTIERSTKFGVTRCGPAAYDNRNDFILTLNGATVELVEYSSGVYRPRTDQSFLEAIRKPSSNTWELIERSGMRYFFGQAPESRLSRTTPASCPYTAVWGLTQVRDPNGNTIDITYRTGELSLVPSQISYGGQTPSAHLFVLEFGYIDYLPTTRPIPSYRRGLYEEVNDLLNTITVRANGQTVRTYQLEYDDEYGGSAPTNCGSGRCQATSGTDPLTTRGTDPPLVSSSC